MNLIVDGFEIDAEILADADWSGSNLRMKEAAQKVVEGVIKNLDPDSTKRFEDYQRENDPCREGE